MSAIFVRCPASGDTASTGIETDQSTFQNLKQSLHHLRCPVCGDHHSWSAGEVWLGNESLAEIIRDRQAAE